MSIQPDYNLGGLRPQKHRPALTLVGSAPICADPRAMALAQGIIAHAQLQAGNAVLVMIATSGPELSSLVRLLIEKARRLGTEVTAVCPPEANSAVRATGAQVAGDISGFCQYAVILDPYGLLAPDIALAELAPDGRYLRGGAVPLENSIGFHREVFLCEMPASLPREVFGGLISRLSRNCGPKFSVTKTEFSQ